MPTHGPGRLAEMAIGTVTQAVVGHAPGPVLLVGPHVATIAAPRRLVAAVDDGSPSVHAASFAGHWARAFGLDLELVEVLDDRTAPALAGGDTLESTTLQGYAAQLEGQGVEASWDVLHGRHVRDAILRHLADRPDAWAVVGTNARHGISRLALGSVAMQVVHHSSVPVVVVR
jgi:nucleotide-binding universal stress UspA family protein